MKRLICLDILIPVSAFISCFQQLPPASQYGLRLYSIYSDRRLFGTTIEAETPYYGAAEWGIVHYNEKPRFPDDADTVSLAAWEAIVASLPGRQRMDPNQVRNARSKSSYDYRPVRRDHDRGRIGIEIAGAKHLFPTPMVSDANAIRVLSLMIANRLSKGPWEDYEVATESFSRPVVIYFNTIRQSLVASQELSLLKQKSYHSKGSFDNIFIRTLGQDKDIPQNMRRKERFAKGLTKGVVNPEQGIILVVQPTDFNDEFRPPGPSIDSVSHLQQLAARASVENLPIVVISPRFLVHQPHFTNNWDQSGFQQSSVFGGIEPARGPTPWILRDFSPPAFVWIGSAISLHNPSPAKDSERSTQAYSRITMMQSVMNDCHAWHIYGAKEQNGKTYYQYLASTSTSAGRPTTDIIKTIFNEWSS
jgi:hypothetical protein